MDKVIIDNIDVSECKYYDDGTCCDKDVTSISCENTDCIYKQLKRKGQFLKEIEKEITTYRLKYDTTHTASKLLDSLASKIRKELYE